MQVRGQKRNHMTSKQKSEGPQTPLAQCMEPPRAKLTFTISFHKA